MVPLAAVAALAAAVGAANLAGSASAMPSARCNRRSPSSASLAAAQASRGAIALKAPTLDARWCVLSHSRGRPDPAVGPPVGRGGEPAGGPQRSKLQFDRVSFPSCRRFNRRGRRPLPAHMRHRPAGDREDPRSPRPQHSRGGETATPRAGAPLRRRAEDPTRPRPPARPTARAGGRSLPRWPRAKSFTTDAHRPRACSPSRGRFVRVGVPVGWSRSAAARAPRGAADRIPCR
jgi:hypothetical protein